MTQTDLQQEIRDIILASVDAEGLTADMLTADVQLFGNDGVGLDSIDALEIGGAIRRKYNIKFKANSEENRTHFHSIATLADFVAQNAGIVFE
jgi:acyl carrier protein